MKRNNFNKLLVLLGVLILGGLSSCIKDYRKNETNLSNLQATVSVVEGGQYQFGSQALLYPATDLADTALFHLNYAAVNVAPADETFSIAIDPTALTTYNGLGGVQYQPLPDSCFTFTATSATVSKGQTYSDPIPVIFYPSKVDPSKNFMLPISITKAPAGITISSNVSTIYYHFIGNPIAGNYMENWRRWNASDTTGALAYNFTDPNIFAPETPTQVSVASVENGALFHISFTNTNGVLSNFSVTLDPSSWAAFGAASVSQAPVIITADPVNGIYSFVFKYTNTSGAARSIIQTFTKIP